MGYCDSFGRVILGKATHRKNRDQAIYLQTTHIMLNMVNILVTFAVIFIQSHKSYIDVFDFLNES